MRGKDHQQGSVFSYVSAEERIPEDHPLRAVRRTVDKVLQSMSNSFDKLYASAGRFFSSSKAAPPAKARE